MPRRARRLLDSSYLHIIVQGLNKEYIYIDEKKKQKLYNLMLKKKENLDLKILAYCIMDNHLHMIVFSEDIENVSTYMQRLNTAYALYYNTIKNRVGYVYRDRYYSEAISTERYLYNCIAYIHYNPVVAKIVNKPEEYKYSSYNDYIRGDGIVGNDTIQLVFGENRGKYKEFIHYTEGAGKDIVLDNNLLQNYKCKIDKNNKDELKEECFKLKEYNFSNRKIAKLIGIDRNKVDRIFKMRQ